MPIKDIITDPFLTTGERLRRDLGLEKFNHAYIQKVINFPKDIYIITVDSRYPSVFISYSRIRKIKSAFIGELLKRGKDFSIQEFKLTPPVRLQDYIGGITRSSVLFFRDLAGEHYMNKNLYEDIKDKVFINKHEFPVYKLQEKEYV